LSRREKLELMSVHFFMMQGIGLVHLKKTSLKKMVDVSHELIVYVRYIYHSALMIFCSFEVV
jgi:hypothetical protein